MELKEQEELQHLLSLDNPQMVIQFFSAQLRQMLRGLSWQSIGKVFHLSYHLFELLTKIFGPSPEMTEGTPEWREISELWDLIVATITRWIWSNGGWVRYMYV